LKIFKLPPTLKVCPTLAPAVTIKAPVEEDVDCVSEVTASPDNETTPVEGFITNEVIVDNPTPETFAPLTVVMKNDALLVVAIAATEEAEEAGTACQEGTLPDPVDVST